MAFGMYLLNPGGKAVAKKSRRRVRRKRNRHFAKSNPMKIRRRRKARSARRNPSRRRRARSRRIVVINPRRRRRRMRSTRRNPAHRSRRRSFSRRNPFDGVVSDVFNQNTLTTAGGVLVGVTVPSLIVNKMVASASMSKLPGLNSSPMARTFYKLIIAVLPAYMLRRNAPRFAEGLLLGGIAAAGNDLLNQSGLLTQITGAVGLNRYYPPARGAGAYLPGTSPLFTGPGSGFLSRSNAPMPRRGMGAPVNRNFMGRLPSMVENPFAN